MFIPAMSSGTVITFVIVLYWQAEQQGQVMKFLLWFISPAVEEIFPVKLILRKQSTHSHTDTHCLSLGVCLHLFVAVTSLGICPSLAVVV